MDSKKRNNKDGSFVPFSKGYLFKTRRFLHLMKP